MGFEHGLIATLIGLIVFTLYGASKEKGEIERKLSQLQEEMDRKDQQDRLRR